jgi:hypothetical protein
MKTPSSRLSLKIDNAACRSISFNDKHQVIEEPDELKGSRPVLKERVGERFPTRLKLKIQLYWVGDGNPTLNELGWGSSWEHIPVALDTPTLKSMGFSGLLTVSLKETVFHGVTWNQGSKSYSEPCQAAHSL